MPTVTQTEFDAIVAQLKSAFTVLPVGHDPVELKKKALVLQEALKIDQSDLTVAEQKFGDGGGVVQGYRVPTFNDNIDVSNTGEPTGNRLYDSAAEAGTLNHPGGSTDRQGLTRRMAKEGKLPVEILTEHGTVWKWAANGAITQRIGGA